MPFNFLQGISYLFFRGNAKTTKPNKLSHIEQTYLAVLRAFHVLVINDYIERGKSWLLNDIYTIAKIHADTFSLRKKAYWFSVGRILENNVTSFQILCVGSQPETDVPSGTPTNIRQDKIQKCVVKRVDGEICNDLRIRFCFTKQLIFTDERSS